jgi:hypothetical protein
MHRGTRGTPGEVSAAVADGPRDAPEAFWRWLAGGCERCARLDRARSLAGLGRIDDALAVLADVASGGPPGLIFVSADPLLEPLRQDGRFRALVASLERGD